MKSKKGCINVSVANIFKKSTYKSEIVTQGLLGEEVDILANENDFIKIRQIDNYEAWVSKYQLSDPVTTKGKQVIPRDHFIRIYQDPNMTIPIKDAVIGCRLTAINKTKNFYQILLPTGELGWIHKNHITDFPELSKDAIIKFSKEFLGYQYVWGGKTPKGFDCSGFVQSVFALLGKQLARDAYLQAEEGEFLSDTWQEAKASDLLFFGDNKDMITHVGISLGNGKFIHALGWVKINSLNKKDPDFSKKHAKTFIKANRYL